jgi:hypothetical protein
MGNSAETNFIKVVKNESGEYFKVKNNTLYFQYDTPEWRIVELFEGFTKGDIKELEVRLGKFNYIESHVEDSLDITESLCTLYEEVA